MDVSRVVAGFPGAVPLDGLAGAWRWELAPGFDFAAVASADGTQLLQLYAMDCFDESLVAEILRFIRERGGELHAGQPMTVFEGFRHPGSAFDVVAAVGPAVHGYYERENVELRELTYAVFPGYRQEFSGRESADEAWTRYEKMLDPQDLRREPVPYLKLRYDNPRTRGGTVGDNRGFATLATLLRELPLLEGVSQGFVEFENRHGQVWRIGWDGEWVLSGENGRQEIGLDELTAFARRAVTGPEPV